MNVQRNFTLKGIISVAVLLTSCLIIVIFISGCFQNYGKIQRDHAVTVAFETGELPHEYHYHFFGNRNHPFAVMGLDSEWTLKARIWRPVELTSDEFKHMTKWIWEDLGFYKYGANILDPEFVKIGIIYTSSWMAAVKVDREAKIVEVMPHVQNNDP